MTQVNLRVAARRSTGETPSSIVRLFRLLGDIQQHSDAG